MAVKSKKNKRKSNKIKKSKKIIGGNPHDIESKCILGIAVIILIIVIYMVIMDITITNNRRIRKISEIPSSKYVLAYTSDLNPGIVVRQFTIGNDAMTELQAYEIKTEKIVLAEAAQINDSISPFITVYNGKTLNVPLSLTFMEIIDDKMISTVNSDKTIDEIISWCKTNGYCISVGANTRKIVGEKNNTTKIIFD